MISPYQAERVASRMIERLAPYCHAIAIAGSLRRQKGMVGDVDLVCVPVLEEPAGTLPGLGMAQPLGFERELAAIIDGSQGAIGYDLNSHHLKRLMVRVKANRVPVDLYFAPDLAALPALLLVITGSRDHVQMLQARARDQGMQLTMDGVTRDGQAVPCADEAAIYAALGLPYRQPHQRER